jgi:hypothetical protein
LIDLSRCSINSSNTPLRYTRSLIATGEVLYSN